MSPEELIEMIDRGITEAWFGDPALGPWPNDPDGGELRISTALINVLVECARSERMGQPVIGTHFITKVIERVLIENEGRYKLD
jgi:hypothetical protein